MALFGAVRHADLSRAAYSTPAIAIDVLFIECDELSQLLRHLKHALDLAHIEERK